MESRSNAGKWIAFTSRSGTMSTVTEGGTANDFFQFFVTNELLDMVAQETNRYASQCITLKLDPTWHDTTNKEMENFFGLHILFGYNKLPESSCYWSNNPTLRVSYMKRVMSRDRFDNIIVIDVYSQLDFLLF